MLKFSKFKNEEKKRNQRLQMIKFRKNVNEIGNNQCCKIEGMRKDCMIMILDETCFEPKE